MSINSLITLKNMPGSNANLIPVEIKEIIFFSHSAVRVRSRGKIQEGNHSPLPIVILPVVSQLGVES